MPFDITKLQSTSFNRATHPSSSSHKTMASYLVTGTSRGIGLALCEALAAKPASEVSVVFAAYRTYTDGLKQLVAKSDGRIKAVAMDVTDEAQIKDAAMLVEKALDNKGLDVLINNAGVAPLTPGGIATM